MREIIHMSEGIYECIYCGKQAGEEVDLTGHLGECRRGYEIWEANREYEIEYFGDPRNEVEEDVDYDEE